MEPASELHLTLHLPSHPVLPAPLSRELQLPPSASIADLKHRIHDDWDGHPNQDGVTVAKGARVLRDAETLGDVFDEELKASPPAPLVLNIIVRPSAWSTPFADTAIPPPSLSLRADPATNISLPEPSPSGLSDFLAADAGAGEAVVPAEEASPAAPTAGPSSSAAATVATSERSAGTTGYTPGYLTPAAVAADPLSSPPLPSPPPSAPSASRVPSTGAAGPYVTYLAHLQRLVPLQRALLLLNLQKALAHYAALAAGGEGDALPEVEELLIGVGLWEKVEESVKEAEKRAEGEAQRDEGDEFRVVQIAGLPYLLHTPPALLQRARVRPSAALLRARAIHTHLTTMLQLLLTLAPAAPAIAHGRAGAQAGARPSPAAIAAAQAVLARAGAGVPVPLPPGLENAAAQQQQQRRRATLSVIINLEAVFALLVPLALLGAKLAFLLWLFGRNASPAKRLALGLLAAAWVAAEAWTLVRRRGQQARERERAERERRRALRRAAAAAAAPPPAPVGGGGGGGGGALAAPGAPPAPQPARERRRARAPPPSRLSPKYWLNALAAVGLVHEARELGLQPRFIAGRPVPPPRAGAAGEGRVRRALRTVATGVVLFVGTLSPEVERKRRRALEKRERLLAERRAREMGRERAQGVLAPEGEGERARAEAEAREPEPARRDPLDGEARERERARLHALLETMGAGGAGPAGRARVPDAELFADGAGGAYVPAAGPSPSAAAPAPADAVQEERRAERAPPPRGAEVVPDVDEAAEEEDDVASASGDGASTSGDEGVAAPRAGAEDEPAGADGARREDAEEGEVDQVAVLF
ncbi:hypothetical protein JCM10450v2_006498 [Rhodotorula kratochvilovae]